MGNAVPISVYPQLIFPRVCKYEAKCFSCSLWKKVNLLFENPDKTENTSSCSIVSGKIEFNSLREPISAWTFVAKLFSKEAFLSNSTSALDIVCVKDNPYKMLTSPCCIFHISPLWKYLGAGTPEDIIPRRTVSTKGYSSWLLRLFYFFFVFIYITSINTPEYRNKMKKSKPYVFIETV